MKSLKMTPKEPHSDAEKRLAIAMVILCLATLVLLAIVLVAWQIMEGGTTWQAQRNDSAGTVCGPTR